MASTSTNLVILDGKQELDLPFGYRFYPRDDEVIQYLKHKIFGEELPSDIIPTIPNLYVLSPEEIPLDEFRYDAEHQTELWVERQWFFFSNKLEGNLSTNDGYWYYTESPTQVEDMEGTIVGFKQAIGFYKWISPNGIKSNKWTIYEYRLNPDVQDAAKINDDTRDRVQNIVLCKVMRREDLQEDDVHAAQG